MARPNRVFYLQSEYNGIADDYPTFDTFTQCFEWYLKALITGFGPYPAVSLEVKDKVATVTLSTTALIYPGTKITIAGTNIDAVDGMQEIDSINSNTFTFLVDSDDNTFTDGITYSYPSLGWSLVERDAYNAIIVNGNSGSQQHFVLLQFAFRKDDMSDTSSSLGYINYANLRVFKISQGSTINNIKRKLPTDYSKALLLSGIYSNYAVLVKPRQRLNVYGDDSFAILQSVFNETSYYDKITYGYGRNIVAFGELDNSFNSKIYKMSNFFISGDPLVGTDGITYNNNSTQYVYYCNQNTIFLGFHLPSIFNCTIGQLKTGDFNFNNIGLTTNINVKTTRMISGLPSSNTYYNEVQQQNYGNIIVTNFSGSEYGNIPGVYYINALPSFQMIPNMPHLKPVQVSGILKNRKIYGVYGVYCNNNSINYDTTSTSSLLAVSYNSFSNTLPYLTMVLLDLTGPIRSNVTASYVTQPPIV